ncbi:hypothetical protein [uncultured Treponema sp.]|uniref:hypothetical protein n=1 Tax=uncultured Treponema sp. TaxID=162155 RepID=UPI0025E8E7BF|nr:hypothetical protein [uncultured Treponema sp.]
MSNYYCIWVKTGKEYIDPLIPGYVFWEADFKLVVPGAPEKRGKIRVSPMAKD